MIVKTKNYKQKHGKEFEQKVYNHFVGKVDYIYRLPDQMTGYSGSKNPCDFFIFNRGQLSLIEAKSTKENRFNFSMLSSYQLQEIMKADAQIGTLNGVVFVEFRKDNKIYAFSGTTINNLIKKNKKSINIKEADIYGSEIIFEGGGISRLPL